MSFFCYVALSFVFSFDTNPLSIIRLIGKRCKQHQIYVSAFALTTCKCNCNCKYDNFYSTVSSKLLL